MMLKRGETDIKAISEKTGILEVEVSLLRKKMQEDKLFAGSTIQEGQEL